MKKINSFFRKGSPITIKNNMAKLKKLAVRVMYNNSETEYDYNSDAATINITPLFKAELFALRNEVIKLKKLNKKFGKKLV